MLNDIQCKFLNSKINHKTHIDETFYNMPYKFPCVLHDRNGCLYISQDIYNELINKGIIRESTGGKVPKINIKNCISKVYGYHICDKKENCPKYKARKNRYKSN